MDAQDYEKALKAAEAEIEETLRERAVLDEKLTKLKSTVEALCALLGQLPARRDWEHFFSGTTMGVSDAIREVLSGSKVPMTPVELKTRLADAGFAFHTYANPMAVVHNTLKRLEAQGELVTVRNAAGQTIAYTMPPAKGKEEYAKHPAKKR